MKNYQTAEYDKHYIDWLKEQNEKMSKLILRWHPYPQEKPINNCSFYLVTFIGRSGKSVGICEYLYDDDWVFKGVSAWAELPKPYEGE